MNGCVWGLGECICGSLFLLFGIRTGTWRARNLRHVECFPIIFITFCALVWFVLQGEFGDISTLAEPKVVDDLLEKAKEAA